MAQINKPTDYFNTVLYTGNGYPTSGTQSITGVGFQPDLIWIKDRDTSGNSHIWTDSVRGNTKNIYSNLTNAEGTKTDRVTSFDSDGFSLGADASQGVNDNGSLQVSWNWLASNTTASNTDGSITSTVSANTTSGFSIVSYTGTGSNATVGHGLGVAPQVVIVKERSGADGWHVGHASLGFTKNLYLNLTNATNTETAIFNDTAPTSSVFSLGNNTGINESGSTYITYCFAEKKGFSKFGSYVGNSNTDGTFVYTGFKPAFVLVKASSTVGTWHLQDSARNPSNIVNKSIYPNSSSAEETYDVMDFTSNGFKIRTTNTGINNDGVTYIYMAFADQPLVGTNNIPSVAR